MKYTFHIGFVLCHHERTGRADRGMPREVELRPEAPKPHRSGGA
jgi:hypothetical protein